MSAYVVPDLSKENNTGAINHRWENTSIDLRYKSLLRLMETRLNLQCFPDVIMISMEWKTCFSTFPKIALFMVIAHTQFIIVKIYGRKPKRLSWWLPGKATQKDLMNLGKTSWLPIPENESRLHSVRYPVCPWKEFIRLPLIDFWWKSYSLILLFTVNQKLL